MARSDRKTTLLATHLAENIWRARLHAEQIGKPLNAFLTIRWEALGRDSKVQQQNSRLLICARRWLDRRDQDLAAVWVIERGTLGNLHTHNLINVPRHLLTSFKDMLPRWTGVPALPKDKWPDDQRQKQHVLGYGQDGIWHFERLYDHGTRVARYMLKGCPYLWHSHGVQYHDQGIVQGKRCGHSNNLGPTARGRYQPPAAAARSRHTGL